MKKTPVTPEFPLWPTGDGETLVQVFRSAAEQSAAEEDDGEVTPGPRSPPPRRPSGLPPLQRRLYEADGHPVRLGRYEIVRCVGSGGMGVVYEAVNVEHGQRVALKTLRWMTAAGLGRFKNEFRSLCGVAHPNLVALYELGAEAGEWFFTMELLEGQTFVEHAQGDVERRLGAWEYLGETFDDGDSARRSDELRPQTPGDDGDSARRSDEDLPPSERGAAAEQEESGVVLRSRGFHEGRLRAALRQLAGAVAALHDLGKVHRDLNPGNVLVTREGRVVLIDFGLVSDRRRRPGVPYDGAGGTPAYMSPEQAAGKPATPASDWYGLGVMLFEALTGQLPFTGSTLRMLTNKRHQEAPPPSALAPDLPGDLVALCSGLLRREPEDRPDAAAVLEILGAAKRRPRLRDAGGSAFFAGRVAELSALDEALCAVRPGRPVAAVVRGPSGAGKTALVTRFLDALAARGDAVLHGACGERESIPHRMLDGAVDALAAHLAALPLAEAQAALPPDARALALVFPVLEGLPAIASLPAPPSGDERAAFACLRALLARLAESRAVVLSIDDAHLGDREDARWLAALVDGGSGAPGLLLLLAVEGDGPEPSPVLDALAGVVELRFVPLGPLDGEEARELALRALPDDLPDDLRKERRRRGDRRRRRGQPARRRGAGPPRRGGGLHRVARRGPRRPPRGAAGARAEDRRDRRGGGPRRARAPPRDRRRGAPRGPGAGGADRGPAPPRDRRELRRSRAREGRGRAPGILARMPNAVTRQVHLDLAQALAARPDADPRRAAAHFQQAGATELAAEHLACAAARAAAGGDCDRAAELWESALEGAPRDTAAARALSAQRAAALARAGRPAAAAAAYLDDLKGAPRAEALDRRRRAAEHLLAAGHVDEGLAAMRPVLEAHGVRWPETPRRALWTLGARVVTLQLRGPRPTPGGAPAPEALARIEALWSAGKGLTTIDPVRAALFVVEALLGAREVGAAPQAALAQALLGSMLVYRGSAPEEARGLELIEEAASFARRSGDGRLLGFSWFCSGLARMCAGRFREALARVDEGIELLEAHGGDLAWERNAHQGVALQALFELGALAARARRAEAWREGARARGDRAGEAQAGLAVSFAILAGGDPEGARAAAREALALSWQGGYGVPHQVALWIEVSSFLYEGDVAAARARLAAAWPSLRASQLLHIQLVRIEALHLRGLTAVADGGRELRRRAQRDAARLAGERRPQAIAAATLLRAAAAASRGEIERAVEGLDDAARSYAAAEMLVHAAAARRARGSLLGGSAGRALVAAADAALAAEGVRDGARWAAMYTGIYGSRLPSG